MRVTVVQLNSTEDKPGNLTIAGRLIRAAHSEQRTDLFVLPEYAPFGGGTTEQKRAAAEEIPHGEACNFFSSLASELRVHIHCGSLSEQVGARLFNTSVVFGPNGREVCRYRKLFLFDARLPNGRELLESKLYNRGNDAVSFMIGPFIFGCTTCYDIRFPELFRALRKRGVNVFLFVAAMSKEHGEAHLEILLRARAIECQAYVIAAQQCGRYFSNTRENYGNSMVVDPWGKVQTRLGNEPGIATTVLDLDLIEDVRARVPLLQTAVELENVISFGRSPRSTPQT